MEQLVGVELTSKDLPSVTWNADLIAIEGPLLSLFQDDSGNDLLYMWLDCGPRGNRWAIIPIDRTTLGEYLTQRLSLLRVLQRASNIIVYDQIGPKRKYVIRTRPQELPEAYWPAEDSLLTRELATTEALKLAEEHAIAYDIRLDGELFIGDLSMIPRLYQQLYSFHYGLAHLEREAVRDAIASVKKWTGGFSAVNLFSGLTSVTPSVHRPRVKSIQYASPGQIRLELLPAMAEQIRLAVGELERPEVLLRADNLYREVYRYFKKQKISGFEDHVRSKGDRLTYDQIRELNAFVATYLSIFQWESYQARFTDLGLGPLPQLRALLAYYRRLKRLVSYQQNGKLKLTDPYAPLTDLSGVL